MRVWWIATVAVALSTAASAADDEQASFQIATDRYLAGADVEFSGPEPADDLFMAGETVRVSAPVSGTAHLAGRRIRVSGPLGDGLYAAGFAVDVAAPVTGDATAAGYRVSVTAPVSGDLRAAASEVTLGADVAGYALLTGELIDLDAAVGGDAVLAGRDVRFGEAARVAGRLDIYVPEPADLSVPERVAPAERVTVHDIEDFDRERFGDVGRPLPSAGQIVGGFIMSVLFIALIATAVIAIAPDSVASWRRLALDRPGRALWSGFLVASALAGSAIILSMTLIGVLLVPVIIILNGLALFAGYTLGAYVLGAKAWQSIGRAVPARLPGKFGIAALGAFLAGIAWVVPIIGWLFAVGLTLVGVGTLFAFILPRDPLLHRPDPV